MTDDRIKKRHLWLRWRPVVVVAIWLGFAAFFGLLGLWLLGRARLWMGFAAAAVAGLLAAVQAHQDYRANIGQPIGPGSHMLQMILVLATAVSLGVLAVTWAAVDR